MRVIVSLLAGLACCALPALASAEPLAPARFQAALAAAKVYAADRTLVLYCTRNNAEIAPFAHLVTHIETEDALNRLRIAGSDAAQNAELVQTIMTNVRYPAAGASDPALDAECKARNVEQNYLTFSGSFSMPLDKRPPFNEFSR